MTTATVVAPIIFGGLDPEWDLASLATLRQCDPISWKTFARLFSDYSGALSDGLHPEAMLDLTRQYHNKCRRSARDSMVQLWRAWSCVHERWLEFLHENIPAPHCSRRPVECIPSLSLLSPRDLRRRCFSVPFYVALDRRLMICAHEIIHFLYFDWLAVHDPTIPVSSYDFPGHAWRVSEVIASVLIADPFAVELFGPAPELCYACSHDLYTDAVTAWRSCCGTREGFVRLCETISRMALATEGHG